MPDYVFYICSDFGNGEKDSKQVFYHTYEQGLNALDELAESLDNVDNTHHFCVVDLHSLQMITIKSVWLSANNDVFFMPWTTWPPAIEDIGI